MECRLQQRQTGKEVDIEDVSLLVQSPPPYSGLLERVCKISISPSTTILNEEQCKTRQGTVDQPKSPCLPVAAKFVSSQVKSDEGVDGSFLGPMIECPDGTGGIQHVYRP